MKSEWFEDMFMGPSQERQVLYYHQPFCLILNETVLSTNFILSISELTWSFLYPRFTNHWFNCSRWLSSFCSVEQILSNLTTCANAVDPFCTLLWHDCAWRYWWVSAGLQCKSVSNLQPTFLTVTPKKLISVVK